MGDTDTNLGLTGGAAASTQIYEPPPTAQANVNSVSKNTKIKDSSSAAEGQTDITKTLFQKGVFTSLPNNPSLVHPNDDIVDYTLSESPPTFSMSTSTTTGEKALPPTPETINQAFDQAFEALIKGKPNENELLIAHYTSPPGTPMTAEETQAYAQVVANFGINAEDYTPKAVVADFMEQLSNAFDDEFLSLLQNQKPPLSKATQAKLQQMHFNPGAKFAGSDDQALQSQFKSIEKQATANIANLLSIPLNADGTSTVPMKSNNQAFAAVQNGYYQKFLESGATKFLSSPEAASLSASDKKNFKAFLADPTLPMSDAGKAASVTIINKAIADVVKSQNLEGIGFIPAPAGTFRPIDPLTANYIKVMNDVLTEVASYVESMPESPTKVQYMNILAAISQALQNFERTIYASQGMTSERAQKASAAKLDMALNQIKANGEKAKEAQDKAAKMEKLGSLGAIIMIIITVIMAIVAALTIIFTLGAAAPAVIAGFSALVAGLSAIGSTATVAGGAAAVTAGVTVAATTSATTVATTALTQATVQTIIQATKVVMQGIKAAIKEAIKAAIKEAFKSVTKEAAKEVLKETAKQALTEALEHVGKEAGKEAVTTALKEITKEASKTALKEASKAALKEAGKSVAKEGAKLSDDVIDDILEQAVKEVVEESVKGAAKEATKEVAKKSLTDYVVQAGTQLRNAGEVIGAAGEIVQGGMTIEQNLISAKLAMIKAEMESSTTLTDANMQILKKLIEQLLALLSGQADLIQYIGQSQTGLVRKTSQTASQISAA